jgi:hypothetical protein
MTNPQDAKPGQAQLDLKQLQELDSAFGIGALVPLKKDLFGRGELVFGSLPLSHHLVAEARVLTPSSPAGVFCGGGTKAVAFAFAWEEMAREFLKTNPILSGTLVTRLQTMVFVWLRPLDGSPPNAKTQDVQIISEGVVPVYAGESLLDCSVLQPGRPLEVDLDTLVVTGSLQELLADWSVRRQFGPPMVRVSARRMKLNEFYWAIRISKATGIEFNLGTGTFVARDPQTQAEQGLESSIVSKTIAAVLQHTEVPAYERKPLRIKAILDAMKLLCVRSGITASEAYLKFVESCLERRVGALLAKKDAATACRKFFKANGLRPYSEMAENKLRHALQQVILKHFGIGESHDRGRVFRGLALRCGDNPLASTADPNPVEDPIAGEKKDPATGES